MSLEYYICHVIGVLHLSCHWSTTFVMSLLYAVHFAENDLVVFHSGWNILLSSTFLNHGVGEGVSCVRPVPMHAKTAQIESIQVMYVYLVRRREVHGREAPVEQLLVKRIVQGIVPSLLHAANSAAFGHSQSA